MAAADVVPSLLFPSRAELWSMHPLMPLTSSRRFWQTRAPKTRPRQPERQGGYVGKFQSGGCPFEMCCRFFEHITKLAEGVVVANDKPGCGRQSRSTVKFLLCCDDVVQSKSGEASALFSIKYVAHPAWINILRVCWVMKLKLRCLT